MTRYTHGHAEPVLRAHRRRTAVTSAGYLIPRLAPGMRLLDIGSGPGTITADLADLVAPGQVTALEVTEEVLALTAVELERREVEVDLVVGDVHDLPFPDGSFDVVHAHQVLQHVADPVQALREMRRVSRPGGLVAARDADYAAFTWWPPMPALDRWLELYRAAARANGGEPDAGRRLLGWALEAGLESAEVGASTWCYSTPDERRWWAESWAARVTESALAAQLVRDGHCTGAELAEMAAGWDAWSQRADGWFAVLHGDLLATA